MPKINTTRGTFHYKNYRKTSETPPIILIHGAGGMYMDWSIVMRRALHAIAIDLSGHGLSEGDGHNTIADYATDVIAFMDALNISQAILVGHSMGGAIALQTALDHPDYVFKLVLIATSSNLQVGDAILNGIETNFEATANLIVKLSWSNSIDEDLRQQGVERLLNTPLEVIKGDFIACNSFDVRDRLFDVDIPALIIAGSKDKMTPLGWNQALADDLSNGELCIIDGQSHMVHVECAENVTRKIQRWLAESKV